ncbi:hypothetical protein ACFWDA_23190 [Rhodococcus zopfii]|uniref:hypothetical protein n=1 Tax=Rhodococcus zopfii TaxID=43772 RepID=UPI003659035F
MTNTVTTARIDLDDLPTTDGPALRPPTDYRNLLRLRRSLPAAALTSALGPIFNHIDLHTLATRGAYLARRAVTDDAPAAELAAVAKVLADALAAPTAAPVAAAITALRTDPQHTHRRHPELLMLAYRDLLTNPAVVNAPPLRAAH